MWRVKYNIIKITKVPLYLVVAFGEPPRHKTLMKRDTSPIRNVISSSSEK
jgi:hypothetical protein